MCLLNVRGQKYLDSDSDAMLGIETSPATKRQSDAMMPAVVQYAAVKVAC